MPDKALLEAMARQGTKSPSAAAFDYPKPGNRQLGLLADVNAPTLSRRDKVFAAMGLNSDDRLSNQLLFRNLTGVPMGEFEDGLAEWENASPVKVWLAKKFAAPKLNQSVVDAYLAKARTMMADPRTPDVDKANLSNVIEKFSKPNTLALLRQLMMSISKPADIDKVQVEDVHSRILP